MNKPFGTVIGEKAQALYNAIKSLPEAIVKNAIESTKNKQKKLAEMIVEINSKKEVNIQDIQRTEQAVKDSLSDYRNLEKSSELSKEEAHETLTRNLSALDEEKRLREEAKKLEERNKRLTETLTRQEASKTSLENAGTNIKAGVSSYINFRTSKVKAMLSGKSVSIADRNSDIYANMKKTVSISTLWKMVRISQELDEYRENTTDLNYLHAKTDNYENEKTGLEETKTGQTSELNELESAQQEIQSQIQSKEEELSEIQKRYQSTAKESISAIKGSMREMRTADDYSQLNPNSHIKPTSFDLDSLRRSAIDTSKSIDALTEQVNASFNEINGMRNKLEITDDKLDEVNAALASILSGINSLKESMAKQEERILKTVSTVFKDINITDKNQFGEIRPNIDSTLEDTPFNIR